jgi:hypothetical protein
MNNFNRHCIHNQLGKLCGYLKTVSFFCYTECRNETNYGSVMYAIRENKYTVLFFICASVCFFRPIHSDRVVGLLTFLFFVCYFFLFTRRERERRNVLCKIDYGRWSVTIFVFLRSNSFLFSHFLFLILET